jgi:hypothetical protein
MSTIEISKDEMLDHALVQCLRLFAQRGRAVRNQQLSSDEHAMENERAKTASKDSDKEVDNQQ